MGPMMPGYGSGGMAIVALVAMLFMVALVVAGIAALILWRREQLFGNRRAASSPADLLRERYARGEITREQYRQALVDLLQDRYVRGDIGLDELEARVKMLIAE